MDAFLKLVAKYIYQHNNADIRDICLIFPNRRAGIFFSKYLSQIIEKPVWMPHIRTITEVMKDLSGLQVADQLTLMFELYKVYTKENKSNESFDEFYYWGEMILNDFDDVDKYLVDAKQLFQNLSDLKEIENQFTLPEEQLKIILEFWKNIKLHESSPLKDDFISVWSVLFDVYSKYRELLISKGIAYEGMINRDVFEKIKRNETIPIPYKRFAIIGFNALNASEKEFFKYLKKNKLADFFWDYDNYYLDNPLHEAGHFIRENLSLFPSPQELENNNTLTSPKNIEIIAVPSDIGQAKLISNILNRWGSIGSQMTETAVVLADEQLLIPVLTSLPEEIKDVNVTLGYPFRSTPVYSFCETLISLHNNTKKSNQGELRFYYKNVTALLNHPYVQMICGNESMQLLDYIVKYNRVFLTLPELNKHEYLKSVFRIHNTALDFIDYLTEISSKTAHLTAKTEENDDFNSEYWFAFITALNRLHDIITNDNILIEIPTLIRLLRKMTSRLSIPFKGEPLAGLQVMGMLETRALDFNNIIMLSANEGILPKSEASTSFIPYNLRRGFGLPTIEHQDAVYAYYFYRILQKAENVALLYNSQIGKGTSEMSRYLFQLHYEPAFHINKHSLNFQIALSDEKNITIPKTSDILHSLNRFTDQSNRPNYLTPTAINAYLDCTLRFYFRYIAQIKVKDEVEEDIEGSMFGKLLHYTMERIYSGFLKRNMTASDFVNLLNDKDLIECIVQAFAAEFFKKENETPQFHGKSLVVKEVLRKYVLQVLEVDKRLAPFIPMEFEKSLQTYVTIEISDKTINVLLGGTIDRIDRTDNSFRIIDYKTGRIERNFAGIAQLFEAEGKKKNKEALQILLYSFVTGENSNYKHLQIVPGLYGMREIFKRDFDYHLSQNYNKLEYFSQIREPYLTGLKKIMSEIFNPDIPFTKVADKKACEFCDYRSICHR
jgi:hypothetical protein